MLVDLHVLAGGDSAADFSTALENSPLDGIALVGYKTLPSAEAVEGARKHGKHVFIGAEVPMTKGHILVFPESTEADFAGDLAKAPDGDGVLAWFAEKNYAVVACHPYHKDSEASMGDRILMNPGTHSVIVVTAQSPISANDLAVDALESLGVSGAGGSAAIKPENKAATLFVNPFDTQEAFAKAVKEGDFWAVALGDEDRFTVTDRPEDPRGDRRRGPRGGGRSDDRSRGGRGGRGDRPDRGGRSRGGRSDSRRGGPEGNRDSQGPKGGNRDAGQRRNPERKGGGRKKSGGRPNESREPNGNVRENPVTEHDLPNGNVKENYNDFEPNGNR